MNRRGNLGHAIYACSNKKCGAGDELIVKNSQFEDIGINRPGHVIKSRTPSNFFTDNSIKSGTGITGRLLEFPNGAYAEIRDNIFVQNQSAQNADLFSIGYESKKGLRYKTDILFKNNSVDCARKNGCIALSGELTDNDIVKGEGNRYSGEFKSLKLTNGVSMATFPPTDCEGD